MKTNRHKYISARSGQRGFTLIELMITLVVLAIFLSIAAPSFTRLMERSRVTSETNNFIGLFQIARAEAVRHNRQVGVRTQTGWRNDVEVYLDADNSGAFSAGDTVLREQQAIKNLVITSGGVNSITFLPDGTTSRLKAGSGDVTFSLCSTVDDIDGRKVQILASGVVRLSDPDSCN